MEVDVTSQSGKQYHCHIAHHVQPDQEQTAPSPQYLEIIRAGAEEHHVPSEYMDQLNKVKHNGFKGQLYVP